MCHYRDYPFRQRISDRTLPLYLKQLPKSLVPQKSYFDP